MTIRGIADDSGIKYDKLRVLLKVMAMRESSLASAPDLVDAVNSSPEELGLSRVTVMKYVDILRRNYIIDDIGPFASHFRSKDIIKQKRKMRFFDPAFSCAVLDIKSKEQMLGDLRTMGLMFESMCVRDIKIYADALDGSVYHYREYNGAEIDLIVKSKQGKWAAIEIKLADDNLDETAKKLIRITAKIEAQSVAKGAKADTAKAAAKIIVVGCGGLAHRRPDGVYVVPISCLKQ